MIQENTKPICPRIRIFQILESRHKEQSKTVVNPSFTDDKLVQTTVATGVKAIMELIIKNLPS